MKMTAGEASLLAKLEKIEHNQEKIMLGIIELSNQIELNTINENGEEDIEKSFLLSDLILTNWNRMDEELKQVKKDKQQAKKEGYTYSAWLKKEGK